MNPAALPPSRERPREERDFNCLYLAPKLSSSFSTLSLYLNLQFKRRPQSFPEYDAMSSCYDPSYEDYLLDVFDINAASDDIGVANSNLSMDRMPDNTHHEDIHNGNGLFEETHWHSSCPLDQRNEFQAVEVSHVSEQGSYAGSQHTLDDSAVYGGVVPAALSAGVTHDSQLEANDWPIEVSFSFLDLR